MHTAGCMRRVWVRKMPRSSGIVPFSASRCSSTDAPEPGGWTPCDTWASWSGSPSRMIDLAEVPIASASASEIWPASSITSTSRVWSRSSRAKSHDVPAISANSGSANSCFRPVPDEPPVVLLALLQALEVEPLLAGRALHLVEQVVDRLVALRRHADPLPGAQERRDQPGAAIRLARPGRALDEQIGAGRGRRRARAARRCPSAAPARRPGEGRGGAAAAGRGSGRRSAIIEPARRRRAARCTLVSYGPPGTSAVGRRLSRDRLAALEDDRAGGVVDLGDGPARAALDGVVARVVGVEVVLLRREREPVRERLLHDLGRRSVPLQAGDRLGVLDELLVGHLEPAEVPPPSRAAPRGGGSRGAAPGASARRGRPPSRGGRL